MPTFLVRFLQPIPPRVYCIVANELLGALVLAHSLRDAGTKKKLAVLVTLDGVTAEAVVQLKVRFRAKLRICIHIREQFADLRFLSSLREQLDRLRLCLACSSNPQ